MCSFHFLFSFQTHHSSAKPLSFAFILIWICETAPNTSPSRTDLKLTFPLNWSTSLHPAFKHLELFAAYLGPVQPPFRLKLSLIHHCQPWKHYSYTNDQLCTLGRQPPDGLASTGSAIHIFSERANDPFYELATAAWKTGLHSWRRLYCIWM